MKYCVSSVPASVSLLVPRPLYFVAIDPFRVTWSERKSEKFPGCSSRIRHRNGLTVEAWEKAVQELGMSFP